MPHPLAPTPPEETSLAVPLGGFQAFFKRITDWIAGMSPATATQYDTDWVTITSFEAGFSSVDQAACRRIGKTVFLRGTIVGALALNATTPVATLPTGFSPGGRIGATLTTTGGSSFWADSTTSGVIRFRATTAATHTVVLSALGPFTVD